MSDEKRKLLSEKIEQLLLSPDIDEETKLATLKHVRKTLGFDGHPYSESQDLLEETATHASTDCLSTKS